MQSGQYITETVRLERLLGEGGMGSVWLADNLSLGMKVAVKFMAPELAERPEALERFRREAQSAARIRSPHVVQIYEHGVTQDALPYIVMELLDGEDLWQRIERKGPLDLEELANIVSQAGKALQRAHLQGIIHRDIKPDNIFLTDPDNDLIVKILDFGIAKSASDDIGLTATGSMIGTPQYASPEQVTSSKYVDLRTDIWSMGAVVYHAVTGKVPFDGPTLGVVLAMVMQGTYPPASTLRQGLPPALDAWFARTMNRDLDARFASAKEMADAFAQAIHGVDPMGATIDVAGKQAPLMPNAAPIANAAPPPRARTVRLGADPDEPEDSQMMLATIQVDRPMQPASVENQVATAPATPRPDKSLPTALIVFVSIVLFGVVCIAIVVAVVLMRGPA